MTGSSFRRQTFVLCIGIVAFSLWVIWHSRAQEGALTTFSGRVIDELGNPIAECTVTVRTCRRRKWRVVSNSRAQPANGKCRAISRGKWCRRTFHHLHYY